MAQPTKQDLIALARQQAARAGIPEDHVPLFLGLIERESSWNPNARGKAGEYGLGQLMPGTAREVGIKSGMELDPAENLRGAATYFSNQLRRFGNDAGLALAAYNWGPSNAAKMQAKPNSVRPPSTTQDYVPAVFKNSLNYGGQVAPSNFVANIFPKLATVARSAVDKMVGDRYATQPDQVERAIKSGPAPRTASAGAPVAPGAPGAAVGGMPEDTFGMPVPELGLSASAPPAAQRRAAERAVTMDDFLKESFGPLAAVADPFPKGFDSELMRIINEA